MISIEVKIIAGWNVESINVLTFIRIGYHFTNCDRLAELIFKPNMADYSIRSHDIPDHELFRIQW